MIWLWIGQFLRYLAKLIIPPPVRPTFPKIDYENDPCPCCGHPGAKLDSVEVMNPANIETGGKIFCRRTCKTCGASCFLATVRDTTTQGERNKVWAKVRIGQAAEHKPLAPAATEVETSKKEGNTNGG